MLSFTSVSFRVAAAIISLPLLFNLAVRPQTPTDPEAELIKSSLNLVHYGDIVDVDVVGSFEYDWRGGLTPEGFLDGLDLLPNRIYALCRSESELAAKIAADYSRILRDPKVQVRVVDRSTRPSAILEGAVRTPHRFQVRRPVRLNELIVVAGGLTDTAGGEIRVFRPANAGCMETKGVEGGDTITVSQGKQPEVQNITVADLLRGVRAANPYIMPGDIVSMLDSPPVYLIGGVANPGRIAFRPGITVARAVATAGGVAKSGEPEKTTIFRREKGESKVFEVDLTAVEEQRAEDLRLNPFDIVEVRVKGGEKRKFPPVVDSRNESAEGTSKFPLRIID
jgi:protein involved in polysaccharide export with SLBB domain